MRINNNISALNAWRNVTQTDFTLSKSLERLSSGFRINRAADDAAGLAISEKMRGQIRGLNQAVRNAQDAISLIQTAEGALNESHSIAQRMRELADQAASDTNTTADRWQIQQEVNQLASELTRISGSTEFNTKKLLDGTFNGTFQIGANAGQNIQVSVGSMSAGDLAVTNAAEKAVFEKGTTDLVTASSSATGLKTGAYSAEVTSAGLVTLKDEAGNVMASGTISDGTGSITFSITDSKYLATAGATATVTLQLVDTDPTTAVAATAGTIGIYQLAQGDGISVMTQTDASNAINSLDTATNRISSQRAQLGAVQNRLEHTINNLSVAAENLTAAESRIRDADMAAEMAVFTRNQILLQAGTAMLAQANQKPQAVLQLLR